MKSKVAIIGAGVSGISSAIHLAKAGYEVHIFESKNFIGGRVFSFRDNITEEIVDNGQHILSGAYTEFLSILNELGSNVLLNPLKSMIVHFATKDGDQFRLDTSILPGKLGLIYGFLKFRALSLESKLLLILLFFKLRFNKFDLGDENCHKFLVDHRQNQQLMDVFWTPLILAVLNDAPANVSAKLLVEVLNRAFFAGGSSSALILPKVDLSALLNPFDKWIALNGGSIHYQSPVSKLIIKNGTAVGLLLKDGSVVQVDKLISTIQPNALMNIIPEEHQLNRDFSYSTIINIYYWLDKHIDTPDFIAMIGTISQWMFNRRNFIKTDIGLRDKYPGMINITISGANKLNEYKSEYLVSHCYEELKSVFPPFKEAKIIHTKIIRDKRATITLSSFAEKTRPNSNTNIKNLWLAGDWTNTGLPATIEGAAISGRSAANEIIGQQHLLYTSKIK